MTAAACKHLDTPIVYHFQHKAARPQLTRCPTTWQALVEALTYEHDERDEKDGPGFILADFSTPYRKAENVVAYTAVCLDLDTHADKSGRPVTPPSPAYAVEQLRASGLAGIVYTTHNHETPADLNGGKPAGPRYRVVLPLSAPIEAGDLQRVTLGAARLLHLDGPGLDPKSWVVGQFFFMPSCRPGGSRMAAAVDGAALDPETIEEDAAPEPAPAPAHAPVVQRQPAVYAPGTSMFDEARAHARGQWRGILSSLGVAVPDHPRMHTACPGCGGKDRFRFDDKDGDGTFLCSQGGAGTLAGDGFDLVQHARHVDAAEALRMVRQVLGLQQRRPVVRTAAPPEWHDLPPDVDEETGEIRSTLRSGITSGLDKPRPIPARQHRPVRKEQAPSPSVAPEVDPETGEIIDPAPPAAANDNSDERLESLISEIERGRTMSGYEELAQSIAADRTLSTMQRERLAAALQGAIRTFHSTKLPIADVRRMVGIVKSRIGATALIDLQDQRNAPDWARRWVFRTDCDRFFSLDDKSSITITAFDFQHSRLVPFDLREMLGFEKPSELCREVWDAPVIGGVCYLPTAGDLFELDGVLTANTYRPDTVPDGIPPEEWSADERETVRLMEAHLSNIIPIEEERRRLLQWMAWAVQRPGDKINWTPLIIGTYGDGKSLLANMLGKVMGSQNVRVLAGGSIVESSFTGWGEGSSVTVIEEVRISGQNRFEVMDRLKPFITNDRVEVHAKHKDPKSVPNTASYLIFSNWVDAVPVDNKDRRYFILMTPFVGQTGQQLEEAGLTQAYFDRLFHGVHEHYRALRGWLQSVDVSDFPAKGRAPDSAAKAQVVEYCRTDDEIAIADAIEAGGLGVTSDLFSSTCLSKAVADAGHQPPKTVAMNRVLQGMGYVQLPERIKWNGEKHRVWYSSSLSAGMDAGRARRLLDDTRFA